jgi:hypothetical protein
MVAFWILQSGPAHAKHYTPVRHYLNGRYGWFRTTQYVQCCVTASGRTVFYGEVAAPYSIPFYAHVVLPGIGTFVALDRSAFNDRVDIYVPYYPYPGIPDWVRGAYWTN